MTNYAPILNRSDEDKHVTVFLEPTEAMRFVLRVRGVSFFIRTAVDLVTEFDEEGKPSRAYEGMGGNIPVSAKVARNMLRDMAGFNERKAARGDKTGMVEVTRFGDCIFFG